MLTSKLTEKENKDDNWCCFLFSYIVPDTSKHWSANHKAKGIQWKVRCWTPRALQSYWVRARCFQWPRGTRSTRLCHCHSTTVTKLCTLDTQTTQEKEKYETFSLPASVWCITSCWLCRHSSQTTPISAQSGRTCLTDPSPGFTTSTLLFQPSATNKAWWSGE